MNKKMKFYKKIGIALLAFFAIIDLNAQNQGLYADTIKWPNTNTITVNFKSIGFSNVIAFQGSVTWDKNTLQWVSQAGNAALVSSNFTFGSSTAVSQGILTYIYFDAVTNHTVADGTVIFSVTYNVINNPVSTYNDNVISFSNTPTTIGIDTAADVAGLSDLATLNSPNIERHKSGYVSFARPAVLSNNGTDITDSVTNRPASCTYQWFQNGSPVFGPASSNYPNAPAGLDSVRITYPNGTVVSCIAAVLPIKLNSFNGKFIDNVNQLSWTTSSEVNTNNFQIEKSLNGANFKSIGKVNASGNSNIAQYYNFIDANLNNAAVSYYRLKMNENNGAYYYSNVIKVSRNIKGSISLYPNPSKTIVSIEGSNIEQLIVTNILGKVVMQKETGKVNNTTLNVSSLSKGMYIVTIKANEVISSLSLLVE